MARRPCGTVAAHAVFFRLGVGASTLLVWFKLVALPSAWSRWQVRTVRWRLSQVAGNVVRHAGAVIVQVQPGLWGLCAEIRTRGAEAARA